MNALHAICRFFLARNVGILKVYLPVLVALIPLQAQSQSEGCQFGAETPQMVMSSAAQLVAGDYLKFVSLIDPKTKLPDSTRNKLSNGLEEFAPDGFSNCVLLTQDNHPNFIASWMLFSSDEANLFLFLAIAKVKNEWLAVKVQVSSDFDEIYSFVR
jgi:hypothetical protein